MTPGLPDSALPNVGELLATLTAQCEAFLDLDEEEPLIVGVRTGGSWVAAALAERLGLASPGEVDIGFHRDDFHKRGLQRTIRPIRIETTEARSVLLVDDVLHSGRTVRAAINALFEFGRPARIRLAVLVDRNGRELPIQADAAATRLTLAAGLRLKLRDEDGLRWQVVETGQTTPPR